MSPSQNLVLINLQQCNTYYFCTYFLIAMIVKKCLGTELKRSGFKQFDLSLTRYDAGQCIDYHNHVLPYFSLNVYGQYLEDNAFSLKTVHAGDLISRTPNYSHKNTFVAKSNLCFNIELTDPNLFEKTMTVFGSDMILGFVETRKMIYNILQRFLDPKENGEIENSVKAFVENINRSTEEIQCKSEWLNRILKYMHHHWDRQLSLTELADIACLSKNYLVRAFKSKFGISIGEYQRSLRLNYMLPQVLDFDQSLTYTAYSAGYYDQSHMIKHFNQYLKCNPLQLRSSVKRFI